MYPYGKITLNISFQGHWDSFLCQNSNSRTEKSRRENASIREYFGFDNFYITAYLSLECFFKQICPGMFAYLVLETEVNAPCVHSPFRLVDKFHSVCLSMPFTKQEKKIIMHFTSTPVLLFPGILSMFLMSLQSSTYHQSFPMPQIALCRSFRQICTRLSEVQLKNAFKPPQLHIK